MGLEWKFNGKRVPPGGLGKALAGALLSNIEQQIERRLQSMVCPVHRQKAKVTPQRKASGDLSFTVEACCPEFVEQVQAGFK